MVMYKVAWKLPMHVKKIYILIIYCMYSAVSRKWTIDKFDGKEGKNIFP